MSNPKMIYAEGGTFRMGCNDGYAAKAPHEVTLSSFYIGQFIVTQKEWEAVMNSNPSTMKGDDLPVTDVSWYYVQKFITKLNAQTGKQYRLPTEAEWEFAARGGIESRGFKYAGSDIADEVAWYYDNSSVGPQPVGQKKANELEIYDMSGNVFEWCQDWYGEYPSTPQVNPKGPDSGPYLVCRGGSWCNSLPPHVADARGESLPSGFRDYDLGFRLVHDFETF